MKKSTRSNIIFVLSYAIILVGLALFAQKFFVKTGTVITPKIVKKQDSGQKISQILRIIKKKYVDEVNEDTLQRLSIDSLLHQLDPHSVYLPAEKKIELTESLEGNFDGIGVEYYILNDTMLVTGVLNGGPAFQSGLKQGDKILKIDSNVVSGKQLPRSEIVGRLKGKRSTMVQLTLLHQNSIQPVVINIKRDKVAVSSIDIAYMINNETAYIRISKFGTNTGDDFVTAIRALKTKGMKKLILDLRDNKGGYVTAAASLANQFFPENKLIVYTEGKHDPRTDYYSTGGGEFEQGKLAIIINENSASASEILAGAVQDLDRGIIIGRRSFGKGLIQEQFSFNDGSALNLTVARYYTPLGRSIQKSYKKGYQAYENEIESRLNTDELIAENFKKDTTDKATAFVTASGKKLYGGGGIQPDVYVKLDTAGYNDFYAGLIKNKVLIDFVFDVLVDRYLPSFLAQNINAFSISDKDYVDFLKYIENRNIKIDVKQLIAAKKLIYADLKVLLCKYHLGDIGYYKAHNLYDNMVKQALISLQ